MASIKNQNKEGDDMNYQIPSTYARAVAYLIDSFIWGVLFLILLNKSIFYYFKQGWLPLNIAIYIILALISFEVFCLKLFGATLGKWIMNLRLVPFQTQKNQLGWDQIITRVICFHMLKFLFSWAPFLIIFYRYDRTHLIDWIAETRVVSLSEKQRKVGLRPVFATVFILFFFFYGLGQAQKYLSLIDFSKGKINIFSEFMADLEIN